MQRHAFTLIELLIVVAIIAILAAIAVPNFLEAQTRSKVSRAKADIRSITTALEAYRVDANKYPNLDRSYNPPRLINYSTPPTGTRLLQRLATLTTPMAYLTSIPKDVFNPGTDPFSINGNNVITYGSNDPTADAPGDPNRYPFDMLINYAIATGYPIGGSVTNPTNCPKWVLFSYGPMQNPLDMANSSSTTVGPKQYMNIVYDPTNGTLSSGLVVRVGP